MYVIRASESHTTSYLEALDLAGLAAWFDLAAPDCLLYIYLGCNGQHIIFNYYVILDFGSLGLLILRQNPHGSKAYYVLNPPNKI